MATLAACGGDEPNDGLLAPPPVGQGVQFGFTVDLAPGEESTYCRYFALPTDMDVVNTTDEPSSAEVAVNLWKAERDLVGEASVLFFYHDLIAVPPGGTAVSRKRCVVADDVLVMTALPHMHLRPRPPRPG